MSLLKTTNLSKVYRTETVETTALNAVDIAIGQGEFVAIMGPSGCGKSTLLNIIGLLDAPSSGSYFVNGEDVSGYNERKRAELRKNTIGFVFQSFNLVPFMTAVENILVAMSITENKLPAEQKEVAYNLLDFVGIDRTKADRTVNRLSGGEQQRVAIARSISTNVDIVLADEPTGNLDEDTENEIVDIFKELAHRFNKCVIVVTHSSDIARKSDFVSKLRKGVLRGDE